MYSFKNLTPTNGFDIENLQNAKQNNYAWSMAELGDYIYVGTGRNVPLIALSATSSELNVPNLILPNNIDNTAEIWRYKKDNTLPWTRVYKAPPTLGIAGFRFMLQSEPANGFPCLYAATLGPKVNVLQSYDGINWFLMDNSTIEGTSSRYMVELKDRVYLATVNDTPTQLGAPMLYESKNPEFNSWSSVIGKKTGVNPVGSITSLAVFNNKLYLGTSTDTGVQIWRSNDDTPKANDWTLVVDKGFGDSSNQLCLSMGTFKDYLYVTGTKPLPLSWILPFGFDLIRIDKSDNWNLVIGGSPLKPAIPTKGRRGSPLSGFNSGFNNPFNVYGWQIQEYKGRLFISTFDDSSNMELVLNMLYSNKEALICEIGVAKTNLLILIYSSIVKLLKNIEYPLGFDFYVSNTGIDFTPIFKNGLNSPYNYGGRMLYVSAEDEFFIGTANPFIGCEVWKMDITNSNSSATSNYMNKKDNSVDFNFKYYKEMTELLANYFEIINENLPIIIKYLSKESFLEF